MTPFFFFQYKIFKAHYFCFIFNFMGAYGNSLFFQLSQETKFLLIITVLLQKL